MFEPVEFEGTFDDVLYVCRKHYTGIGWMLTRHTDGGRFGGEILTTDGYTSVMSEEAYHKLVTFDSEIEATAFIKGL